MKKAHCDICKNEILETFWMASQSSDICLHCWIQDRIESTRKAQPTKWCDFSNDLIDENEPEDIE